MVRRSDFLDLIIDSPQELEKFHMMKDTILFENNKEFLEAKCASCNSYNHEIQHCHLFHFQPDRYVIFKRDILNHLNQDRDPIFSRQRISSFKNLVFGKETQIVTQEWKDRNNDVVDQYCQEYLQMETEAIESLSDDENNTDYQEEEEEEEDSQSNDDSDNESDNSESENEQEDGSEENYKQNNQISKQVESDQESSDDSEQQVNERTPTSRRKNNHFTIKEEADYENEISQSCQRIPHNKIVDTINEDIIFKNSEDNSSQDQDERQDYMNSMMNNLRNTKLSEIADQEESILSNQNNLVSDVESYRRVSVNKNQQFGRSLQKESSINIMRDQVSNTNIDSKSQIQGKGGQKSKQQLTTQLSLQGLLSPPTLSTSNLETREKKESIDLGLRRSGYKQLTIQTNQTSDGTINKIPTQVSESNQNRQATQTTSKCNENDLKLEIQSFNSDKLKDDESPQLIFFDMDDHGLSVHDVKNQLLQTNGKFQFDTIQQIEDISDDFNQINQKYKEETVQNNKLKYSNEQPSKHERSSERKITKQKSVRINSNNDIKFTRKSTRKLQTQLTISDASETAKSKTLIESRSQKKSQTLIATDQDSKKRKTSIRRGSELNMQIGEQKKYYQENQVSAKKNKNEGSHSKNKQKHFANQENVFDTIEESPLPLQKQKSKKSSKVNEYEFHEQQDISSPGVSRRQFPILGKTRSQSQKNLAQLAGKQGIQQTNNLQSINISQKLQKNNIDNQFDPTVSSRGSISQSIHLAFQSQYQQDSTLAEITSQNSIKPSSLSQTKFKQKQEKQKNKTLKQQKSLLQELARQDININSNQSNKNHNNPDQSLQRKDSNESVKSNGSNLGQNSQYRKKKSAFSKQNSKQISQNSIKRFSVNNPFKPRLSIMANHNTINSIQLFQQQQQQQQQPTIILPPQSNQFGMQSKNIVICPPSPLVSPYRDSRSNSQQGLSIINFMNKPKSNKLNVSNINNESLLSNAQKSRVGDNSPKSALSGKQMIGFTSHLKRQETVEQNFTGVTKNQNFLKVDDNQMNNQRRQSTLNLNLNRNNMFGLAPNQLKKVNLNDPQNMQKQNQDNKINLGKHLKTSITGPHHKERDRSPTLHPEGSNTAAITQFQLNQQQYFMNQQQQQQMGNQMMGNQINQVMSVYEQNLNESVSNNYGLDEEQNIFNIMSFENMKIFQHYFPKGNYPKIIQKNNVIISKNFMKFLKTNKKSKGQLNSQKRKQDENNNSSVRRGSFIRKQQALRKKSIGQNDSPRNAKSNQGVGSDDKVGVRSRGNSIQQYADENSFSNDSENAHKYGSPPQNNENMLHSDYESKLGVNSPNMSALENKRILSPIPKSIFNRTSPNN